ncbi:hypothetical protein AGMMS49545_22620 [Betaproteobacteria bacterium]|nr:hypothetical protein AGMMS49545_22620 [Betaproteobacteria bacterium]GHU49833.1 hypothetical protein AGMMS50289_26770 [Betaproteobacteria bacterium]
MNILDTFFSAATAAIGLFALILFAPISLPVIVAVGIYAWVMRPRTRQIPDYIAPAHLAENTGFLAWSVKNPG